ncbi:MAG: hypothetical protein WCN89_02860 [bacterium]
MSLWIETSPEKDKNCSAIKVPAEGALSPRWLGINAALCASIHRFEGARFETIMRGDLRILALAGLYPERAYKKISVFKEVVSVLQAMRRLIP